MGLRFVLWVACIWPKCGDLMRGWGMLRDKRALVCREDAAFEALRRRALFKCEYNFLDESCVLYD